MRGRKRQRDEETEGGRQRDRERQKTHTWREIQEQKGEGEGKGVQGERCYGCPTAQRPSLLIHKPLPGQAWPTRQLQGALPPMVRTATEPLLHASAWPQGGEFGSTPTAAGCSLLAPCPPCHSPLPPCPACLHSPCEQHPQSGLFPYFTDEETEAAQKVCAGAIQL